MIILTDSCYTFSLTSLRRSAALFSTHTLLPRGGYTLHTGKKLKRLWLHFQTFSSCIDLQHHTDDILFISGLLNPLIFSTLLFFFASWQKGSTQTELGRGHEFFYLLLGAHGGLFSFYLRFLFIYLALTTTAFQSVGSAPVITYKCNDPSRAMAGKVVFCHGGNNRNIETGCLGKHQRPVEDYRQSFGRLIPYLLVHQFFWFVLLFIEHVGLMAVCVRVAIIFFYRKDFNLTLRQTNKKKHCCQKITYCIVPLLRWWLNVCLWPVKFVTNFFVYRNGKWDIDYGTLDILDIHYY